MHKIDIFCGTHAVGVYINGKLNLADSFADFHTLFDHFGGYLAEGCKIRKHDAEGYDYSHQFPDDISDV